MSLCTMSKAGRAWLLGLALAAPAHVFAADDDLFRVTPEQAASTLGEYFQKATDDIAQCKIRDARQEMSLIGFKINRYKNAISRDEKKTFESRLAGLTGAVKQEVDSLVKVNLSIIRKNGRSAGNEFRQYLSAQQGLSETELAAVDEAILTSPASEEEITPPPKAPAEPRPEAVASVPSPERPLPSQPVAQTPSAQTPSVQTPPVQTPPAPAPLAPSKPESFSVPPPQPPPVVEQPPSAPPHAQKADTIPPGAPDGLDKGGDRAVTTAAKIRALLDDGKTDEAMTVFQIYQLNLQRFLSGKAYADLKNAAETAVAKDRDERARAQETAQKIERLLDLDRAAEAATELNGSREGLRKYLDKNDFKDLDSRVARAVADAAGKQAAAHALMRDLRGMLDAGKTEDAYVSFDKSRSDLDRGLSKEEMAGLKKDVMAARDALQDKKKLAALCKRDIASLIKAGKGAAALARFTENRSLLQQYLDPKAFAALETDAGNASREFLAGQERARTTLSRVDSLLSAGRILAAHDLFEDAGAKLRRDLASDQRFFETKDRLTKAYDSFKADKALAVQTERKIEYLNTRKEGRKADALFQQEKERLRKFIEPSAFDKLDQAVRRAKSDYESNYASARTTVSKIEELLGGKKIEQAYKAYENAEDDLDFYFNDDKTIAALGKRVKDAYAALQDKRQWALSQARQIKRLIEKNRGNQACARFQETRAELAEYLDAKTLVSLDTSVARANGAYTAAQSRAETGAARIRALIVQNQIEDAYAAFDTSETDLETYLAPNAFSALKTLVEKFNGELQGKKQDALRTAGSIDRLIDRKDGDSAFAVFRQNDAVLAKYLKAATYKAVAARAAKAKDDWEKNDRQAMAVLTRIKDLLDRDKVEAAYDDFDDKRDFLEHYLDRVSFGRLETAVRAPYEFFLQKRKQARTTVSVLRRMIGRNQGTEARAEFESWDRDLGNYLPAEEYTDIKARIAQAYSKSVLGRRDAKATSDKIRRLLNGDRTTDAYRIFQDSRSDLELYSSKFDFDRLQTEVISAYDEQEDKRKQAKDYAKKLRQLVSKNKLLDAYKGFATNRRTLSEWLDAEEFNDLDTTVVGTYEKAKVKVRTVGKR
jgi:hypothetical protein